MKKHSTFIYFLLISGLASLLNYITYPLLGRILPSSQFVNVTVALSFLTQIATVLLSIVALSIGLTKEDKDSKNTISELQTVVLRLFLGIIILFTILSPFVFKAMKLPVIYLLPIVFLLIFSVPTSVFSGFLNGKNKIVKVALVSLISSSYQFMCTILLGVLTHNGVIALLAMSFGQFISIIFILLLFKNDSLPRPSLILKKSIFTDAHLKKLSRYAIVSSIGILIVNILQIIDLLIVKSRAQDILIYTDIYVISRAVFFAGLIFIWPFLSHINIKNKLINIDLIFKLLIVLLGISMVGIVSMWLFGNKVLEIIMGNSYSMSNVQKLSLLSIGYKFFWLCITSCCLYFIVIRSYLAFYIPVLISIITLCFILLSQNLNTTKLLIGLNLIGLFGMLICVLSLNLNLKNRINVYNE